MDRNQEKEITSVVNQKKKKLFSNIWFKMLYIAFLVIVCFRIFFIELYLMPTPGMEGTLHVGDFITSSKIMWHKTYPSSKLFIFHWPLGDSIYKTELRSYAIGQVAREPVYIEQDRELNRKVKNKDFVVRPINKKDHYFKRCVAGPGDSIQIIDRQIFLNGKPVKNPKHLQYLYQVQLPQNVYVNNKKLDEWGIDFGDNAMGGPQLFNNGGGVLFLDNEQVEKLKSLDPNVVIQIYPQRPEPLKLFPFDTIVGSQNWSADNYGPIWIPKARASTNLSLSNLPFYRKAIEVYEGNKLEIKGKEIFINGTKADSYTFKQDYYWAMGDNRHNSEDSRFWGYVPFDHIVGKPLFIWFSTKEGSIRNGINWDRIFTSADKE